MHRDIGIGTLRGERKTGRKDFQECKANQGVNIRSGRFAVGSMDFDISNSQIGKAILI